MQNETNKKLKKQNNYINFLNTPIKKIRFLKNLQKSENLKNAEN